MKAYNTNDDDSSDIYLGTDNRTTSETAILINPVNLMRNALENECDDGAMGFLYKDVLDGLVEYAETAPEAEDDVTLHDPDIKMRRRDFLIYLRCKWDLDTDDLK